MFSFRYTYFQYLFKKTQMIRTCSINESLMLNPSRSISKSPFESHFYFSFKYVFLQQFQFVSAILARTTTSLDDQGSSRSHHFLRFWKAKPASSSTRTSVQSPMDIHLQQMHWTSGLLLWAEASVSQASFSCTGSILAAPASKATSSGFSPSVGIWQRDAGIGWTHPLKCAHA